MEAIFDNRVLASLAAYGELQAEEPSAERTRQLAGMVVHLLEESGVDAVLRLPDVPAVAFRFDGRPYLMGLTWGERAMDGAGTADFIGSIRSRAEDGAVMVLSMSGYESSTPAGMDGSVLLWDRTHVEAALCGLVSVSDLLAVAARAAFVDGVGYAPLARMLTVDDASTCPRMATPDLLPPPWPVFKDSYNGVPATLALVGEEDGWPPISGIAALDVDRLVVLTEHGLVELDTARGSTSWIMRLAGCVNEPVVMPDGSVLAVCNGAVVRVTGDWLEAVAGGFTGNVHVLAGPDGEAWVVSGSGPTFGAGRGTLALTRISDRVGGQHRYDIEFNAGIHTAGWLAGRKFFLAAASNSTVIDLNRSSRASRDDWIPSVHDYRAHLLVVDGHRVITAAGNSTGLGVTVVRTDVRARSNELLADLTVNLVSGLCVAPDGTGYLLGDVYGARHGPRDPWPVLIRLPGLRPPTSTTAATPQSQATVAAGGSMDPYDAVRLAARGERRDYALEPRPIDDGGQAEVFRARHKPSGVFVAFKRLRSTAPDAVARMKREIDVARALGDNPHVMAVLDHSDKYEWFVMPLAQESAATVQAELSRPEALRQLVTAICEALRPAHALGWIHRDLKPGNLLRRDGVWTVGDWGYGRRPRGQTTNPDRTRIGAMLGTEGFAAPELSVDAHQAGPQADIYSIGQIIGWALRGVRPQANTPLLPVDGPWRHVAKEATLLDPARRPATVDDLLELIRQEFDHDQPGGGDAAAQLMVAANQGDAAAAAKLFALAARSPNDADLYCDVLARLDFDAVHAAVTADPPRAIEVVHAMREHLGGDLSWEEAARITTWLHWIEVWAADHGDLDLLEETVDVLLAWDARWDQWTPQRHIRAWMATLEGEPAAVVARLLRRNPDAARHFAELNETAASTSASAALSGKDPSTGHRAEAAQHHRLTEQTAGAAADGQHQTVGRSSRRCLRQIPGSSPGEALGLRTGRGRSRI
ncbi:hypothetical protein RB614_31645 [Phytohabitans sp. ZYX-F-186]|uniref:non-specific serine/threonine protein kinase n=1 Tax=Phytohabitans maris TaxID=3071409 RepID=A0ABU0ZPY4_9ACTN|nr:hypothetical protein [Phytohabitans sp. ZYX-F-186]MDQ7909086.1 hypothetical protein [Phytohabitans sp. ZYX-F-186]